MLDLAPVPFNPLLALALEKNYNLFTASTLLRKNKVNSPNKIVPLMSGRFSRIISDDQSPRKEITHQIPLKLKKQELLQCK